jgi:hypothetical protein
MIEGDRRGRHVYLTSQGEKLYRRLLPENAAANERILSPLKPHERELLRDFIAPGAARSCWTRSVEWDAEEGLCAPLPIQKVVRNPRRPSAAATQWQTHGL